MPVDMDALFAITDVSHKKEAVDVLKAIRNVGSSEVDPAPPTAATPRTKPR
jgi:hypothetical protein